MATTETEQDPRVDAAWRREFLIYATGPDQLYIRHERCKGDSQRFVYINPDRLDKEIAGHRCP